MNLLQALILGAIEGFAEFLPISSTAHLTLAARLLHLAESDFLKSFIIIIQFGAVLAIFWLYRRTFIRKWEINKKVLIAFLPTALIGFALYKLIKGFLLGNTTIALWALLIGGVGLVAFEWWYKRRPAGGQGLERMSTAQAALIGLAQSLAVVPGVSRSAATIVGGLALGLERRAIVEFSFLLAVPTLAAATGYDLYKSASAFSLGQVHLLAIGFTSAFICALLGVKFLLNYVQRNTFTAFGIYRIIVALIFLFLFK